MKLLNLTGRSVQLNTTGYGYIMVPPVEDDETFAVPTSDARKEIITVDGARVIGWDETHIEDGLLFPVRQEVQIENTYRLLPPPQEGIGYIVQSNVAAMYTERDDLFFVAGNALHRPAAIERTTSRMNGQAIIDENRALRHEVRQRLHQDALGRLRAFTGDREHLTIYADNGITWEELRAAFGDESVSLTSQ